jgi:peptidoglycan/LPS O-acetylase OafA/YrhL
MMGDAVMTKGNGKIGWAYSPAIEGLRGLSVIGVVLFHLKLASVAGGYAGVDVFFVISGFLISAIISNKRITAADFLWRRFRRIIPAYLVTIVVIYLFFSFISSPNHVDKIHTSFTSSALFYSNYFFWNSESYFSDRLYENPFLHTWSLGVEIQFYLLSAFVMLALNSVFSKVSEKLTAYVTVTVFFISLLAAATLASDWLVTVIYSNSNAFAYPDFLKSASFYFMPSRLYQFLMGVMAYKYLSNYCQSGFYFIIGFLIVVASFVYGGDFNADYVGFVPAFGAVLLLLSRDSFLAKFVLGNTVMKWLGQRSYSMYLVHFPVIAYFLNSTDFGTLEVISSVAISIVLTSMLFTYVEMPLRKGKFNIVNVVISVAAVVAIVVFSINSLSTLKTLLPPFTSKYEVIAKTQADVKAIEERDIRDRNIFNYFDNNNPNIYIIGDSLGSDLFRAFKYNLKQSIGSVVFNGLSHRCQFMYPSKVRPNFRTAT